MTARMMPKFLGPLRVIHQRLVDEPDHEVEGDVVEHDREDDLMCAGLRLEEADQIAPQPAREQTREDGQRNRDPTGGRQHDADGAARQGAHDRLALSTDVEQAGAEWDRDREARENQGCRVGERL
jgi:hypothetical protein